MLSRVQASAVMGIDAYRITVEVDVSNAMPYFAIVGLPDAAVNESKERVRSAIRNSSFFFPFDKKVIVNLAPADVPRGELENDDAEVGHGIARAKAKFQASKILARREQGDDRDARRENDARQTRADLDEHQTQK